MLVARDNFMELLFVDHMTDKELMGAYATVDIRDARTLFACKI